MNKAEKGGFSVVAEVKLNEPLLKDYMDNIGGTVVQKMLELYIQQSTSYLADIAKALANEEQELWHENCHKMKGAAASVGLKTVHEKLAAIEKSNGDFAVKQAYLAEIEVLNNESILAFKRHILIE